MLGHPLPKLCVLTVMHLPKTTRRVPTVEVGPSAPIRQDFDFHFELPARCRRGLLREARHQRVQALIRDLAALNRNETLRATFVESQLLALAAKLDAIAVPVDLGGLKLVERHPFRRDTDARERVLQAARLGGKLPSVREVLPLAAATLRENGTRRRHPIWAGRQDLQEFSLRVLGLLASLRRKPARKNPVSGRRKRDKDYFTHRVTSYARPPARKVADLEYFIFGEAHWFC